MNKTSQISYPRFACLSAFWLKVIALAAMICDHIGYTGLSSLWWLRLAGRLAFPIYVFLLVQGFYHTKSAARYALRLLAFAIVTEPCFNFMCTRGRSFAYPGSQNVMFTLLICLLLVWLLEIIKRRAAAEAEGRECAKKYLCYALGLALCAAATAAACLLADALKTDYKSWGVLLAVSMWLFRGNLWLTAAGEAAVFCGVMPRYTLATPLFGGASAPFYDFALLSMIPIALYNGRAGLSSKPLQYFFYLSYALHMLLLGWLAGF